MFFERIEVTGLSHYSYAISCPADGRMIVVDPKRDVDDYIVLAQQSGMRIAHVLETHIHADFASGARELAERTGATLHESGYDSREQFEIRFAHHDIFDGDSIEVGSVRVQALHTPGHTPEHLSFLIYDLARSKDTPMIMLSGDFLFVGSLGRPDLLGEESKEKLARSLYRSVRDRLTQLPDGIEIHPAHGAGSMCGSGMGGRAYSTLGFERIANPYLNTSLSENEFIERILGSVPPRPSYYPRMKQLNSDGPRVLGANWSTPTIDVNEVEELIDNEAVPIDTRDQVTFGNGHLPGSIGIPFAPNLLVWASWVVPYDTPLVLVCESERQAKDVSTSLARVGLDDIQGYLEGGFEAWHGAGKPTEKLRQMNPREVQDALARDEDVHVLDVRSDSEWASGHVEGAIHQHGVLILEHLNELPAKDTPLAVMCGGGFRATVIASALKREGFTHLANITGGMHAWQRAGMPVTHEETPVGATVVNTAVPQDRHR